MTLTINPTTMINHYEDLQPLIVAMKNGNDKLPKNTLPVDTDGTIQQNADKATKTTASLYNAHGIINSKNPNSLIAYA